MAKPDMIGMVVRDMGASLRFYRLLGLEIPVGKDSEDHVEVVMPNGLRIAWDSLEMIKSIYPGWVVPEAGQRMTLAFLCDSPAEVDALYDKVVQHGYHGAREPWDTFWGQRYAVVIDPDGSLVDLFAGL